MIKRTVGLRPIKYSKLPSDVQVGLFNAKPCQKQAIEESFLKFSKNGYIKDESEMWKNWNNGRDASDLDYVLLFSDIPHNALKDIWYITGCDKIMKFASFNRIYTQCVSGDDILWVNCNQVEHIQQKIKWDKLIIKKNNISEEADHTNKVPADSPAEISASCGNTETSPTAVINSSTHSGDTLGDSRGENDTTKNMENAYSIVNVIDNVTDDEIRTWVYNLPKKVVSIDENVSLENLNMSDENENATCTIL